MANPRRMAVTALISILDEGGLSHIVTADILNNDPDLDDRDRAFFMRLVKSVMEHLLSIDEMIDRHSSTRVAKMKPFIRETLRVAVCQMLYFESVPDSAAVNEAVKAVKKSKFRNLQGFVNAVLRAVAADPDKSIESLATGKRVSELSLRYSMPAWIVEHFLALYPEETVEKMLDYLQSEPGVTVRVNVSKADASAVERSFDEDGIGYRRCLDYPPSYKLSGLNAVGSVDRLEAFRKGYITVQDISSTIAVADAVEELIRQLSAENDEEGASRRILVRDICSAPGGKAMAAADLLTGHADVKVLSFDVSEGKCRKIRENTARCGFENIVAAVRDAREPLGPGEEQCDFMIADVPCSGLGIMGRKKDIRYRLKPGDLTSLTGLQQEIMEASTSALKKGGLLMYSTCTVNPEENDRRVDSLCADGGFRLIKKVQLLPGADGDGFFYALLIKENQ